MFLMFGDDWVIHNTSFHDTEEREERHEEAPEPKSSLPFAALIIVVLVLNIVLVLFLSVINSVSIMDVLQKHVRHHIREPLA